MAQQKYETTVEWKRGKPIVSDFALQTYIEEQDDTIKRLWKEWAAEKRRASRAENKWKEWAREETDGMKQAIIELAQNYADYWGED